MRLPGLHRLRSSLQSFGRKEDGISAVEFALIAPLMMLIYFACIELSFMMILDRKVTASAAALGDLAARDDMITDAEVTDIFEASRMILQPNDIADARLRLTSITDDGSGTLKVDWSEVKNMTAHVAGTPMTVPDNIVPAGGSVIYAEVEFDYESIFGYFFKGKKTLTDEFYLRPRSVDQVTRCASC